MDIPNIKIIETVIAIVVYIILRGLADKFIEKTVAKKFIRKTRGKIVKKALNLILLITVLIFILILWGVDQAELAIFLGSTLAILGIALFAQWSILSNITAGIILFFNHFIKLDHTITVIDKDYEVEGRVSDIGIFFVILKTKEGEQVSIPNSVFIQKMIKHKIKV